MDDDQNECLDLHEKSAKHSYNNTNNDIHLIGTKVLLEQHFLPGIYILQQQLLLPIKPKEIKQRPNLLRNHLYQCCNYKRYIIEQQQQQKQQQQQQESLLSNNDGNNNSHNNNSSNNTAPLSSLLLHSHTTKTKVATTTSVNVSAKLTDTVIMPKRIVINNANKERKNDSDCCSMRTYTKYHTETKPLLEQHFIPGSIHITGGGYNNSTNSTKQNKEKYHICKYCMWEYNNKLKIYNDEKQQQHNIILPEQFVIIQPPIKPQEIKQRPKFLHNHLNICNNYKPYIEQQQQSVLENNDNYKNDNNNNVYNHLQTSLLSHPSGRDNTPTKMTSTALNVLKTKHSGITNSYSNNTTTTANNNATNYNELSLKNINNEITQPSTAMQYPSGPATTTNITTTTLNFTTESDSKNSSSKKTTVFTNVTCNMPQLLVAEQLNLQSQDVTLMNFSYGTQKDEIQMREWFDENSFPQSTVDILIFKLGIRCINDLKKFITQYTQLFDEQTLEIPLFDRIKLKEICVQKMLMKN